MQIHITRDDQSFGPYSEEQTREYITKGQLRPEDLAWIDGSAEWVPLSQLLSLPQPETKQSLQIATQEALPSFQSQVSTVPQVQQPQVAVVGINPGTAGCLSMLFAVIGLPFFSYIQPGKIARGVVVQLIYWAALALAFFGPLIVGGGAAAVAQESGNRGAGELAAGGAFLGMMFLPGLVWVLGIIFTSMDVNKCVKAHNAGRGVSYT